MAWLLVEFWTLWGGRLKLPGAGLLIRLLRNVLPGLQAYKLTVPGVGTASLDFRDTAAFGMLKVFRLSQLDTDAGLFAFLTRALRPGMVFWDVGANVGFVSGYF